MLRRLYDWTMRLADLMRDRLTAHEIVERMRAAYMDWFRDVESTRGFEPVRIDIGNREDLAWAERLFKATESDD